MTLGCTRKTALPKLLYGDTALNNVMSVIHLGIRQDAYFKGFERTSERCQKAKNAFYARIGMGVHPSGLNPHYGCELWNSMTKTERDTINRLQHYIAKRIQGFT